MLSDGYWKLELKKIIHALRFWRKIAGALHMKFFEHQVNRQILYSAMVVRKIIEKERWEKGDRKNCNVPEPEFSVLDEKFKTIKYPYVGGKEFIGFALFAENYNMAGKETELLLLEHVCNSIIHSYVWGLVWRDRREIAAFGVASDRYKEECLYLVMLDDWLGMLEVLFEYGNV